MPTETVTVAFVNDPKPGKKYGSIKSEAGDYYSVEPDRLALFKKGGTYEINYTFDKTGQYRNFKSMVGASPQNKSVANGRSPDQSEAIFVTGTIQQALQGTGSYPDEAILFGWIVSARRAFRRAMAVNLDASKPSDPQAPLDDEIPF